MDVKIAVWEDLSSFKYTFLQQRKIKSDMHEQFLKEDEKFTMMLFGYYFTFAPLR